MRQFRGFIQPGNSASYYYRIQFFQVINTLSVTAIYFLCHFKIVNTKSKKNICQFFGWNKLLYGVFWQIIHCRLECNKYDKLLYICDNIFGLYQWYLKWFSKYICSPSSFSQPLFLPRLFGVGHLFSRLNKNIGSDIDNDQPQP